MFPDDPKASRLAWVEADEKSRTNQSHPSLSKYSNNEDFWQLIDALKEIATNHGQYTLRVLSSSVGLGLVVMYNILLKYSKA